MAADQAWAGPMAPRAAWAKMGSTVRAAVSARPAFLAKPMVKRTRPRERFSQAWGVRGVVCSWGMISLWRTRGPAMSWGKKVTKAKNSRRPY